LDEGNGEEESEWIKQLKETFAKADVNADGTLSFGEAATLMKDAGNTQVSRRIEELEAQVAANSQKLDRILQLLEDG
jgi:Ca2+-binding EF-hand superfamily protein